MIVKITATRQVTLPAHVLDALSVGPGDRLQLIEGPDGYLLRPRRIEYSRLGTLREQMTATRRLTSGHSASSPMTQLSEFRPNGAESALTALIP